jgi:hypothetical protein
MHIRVAMSQGCRMIYLPTKNTIFGTFLKSLEWNLEYGNLLFLEPFGVFCGQLVYLVVIWYKVSHFGMLYYENSGYVPSYLLVYCIQYIICENSYTARNIFLYG